MNRQQVLARLVLFEGSVNHMYRCTGGEVTAGVGHAIPVSGDALRLDWQINGRKASALEISGDFARVRAAAKGMLPSHYEPLSVCRLSENFLTQLANEDITAVEAALTRAFPAWHSYPEPVQEALFDMAFNLGMAGLRKFPKLLAAVTAGDWATAAAECERQGISPARNEATAALFRSASESE
ncbi:MAG: hypothetical protein JO336_20160 [Acidobacteriia bacterium]|nr:hypothetical protein [Terriglobia bacterium]MBV8907136.1 hypothetical protein [Terriglobia bacterium]